MVHGGGSCSGGGFSGGGGGFSGGGGGYSDGGGGFSSGGFTFGTTYYHLYSNSESTRRGKADCKCCAACCLGLGTFLGIVVCCKKQSLKRRIGIMWGWIFFIVFIASLSVSVGTYGPRETEATETDMIDINSGLSTDFCTGVKISSTDSQFDAYLLTRDPTISSEKKNYTFVKSTYVPNDKYEYWGYYLLKGSVVRTTACPGDHSMNFYIIRGKNNFDKWKEDNFNGDTYLKMYFVYCFDTEGITLDYKADKTGEYYFVFANPRSTWSSLSVKFELDRTVYDLSHYNQWCKDVRNCDLSYKNMGSSESLVVFVKSAINEEGDATIVTGCEKRASLFVVVFFLVPLIAGLIGTGLLYLKFRNTNIASSTNTGNIQTSRLLSNDYQRPAVQSAYVPIDNPPSYQEATYTQK